MNEMAQDPLLWTGLVLMAGALGAVAARAVKAPAACGAMAGGFALAAGMGDGASHVPALIQTLLLTSLTFLLGAEIDLPRLVRVVRSTAWTVALQAVAVTALVFLACRGLGIESGVALAVAVAAIAASPAAIIAVVSESRARGDFTQRLLLTTSGSFLLAVAFVCPAVAATRRLGAVALSLVLGVVAGLIMLIPLSRMGTRGTMVAFVGICVVLIAASADLPVLIALPAGFMAGNFVPNREVIRDALRDLALPGAVALFAMAGAQVTLSNLTHLFPAAVALLAARGVALILPGMMARGTSPSVLQVGLVPMGGAVVMAPFIEGLEILVIAGFLSEWLGMIGTRWALVRSGEAAGASENPEAWRAQMR